MKSEKDLFYDLSKLCECDIFKCESFEYFGDGISNISFLDTKKYIIYKIGLIDNKKIFDIKFLDKLHRQPLNAELTEYLNKYENIIIKYKKYERNFCLITKNVNSRKISQMNDNFDNTIKKIIDNLKYLSKYDGDVFYFDLFKEIIEYHSILKISEDEILNLLINKISELKIKYPQFFVQGLTHLDLIESNILVTPKNKVLLIDYDFLYHTELIYSLVSYLSEQTFYYENKLNDMNLLKNNKLFITSFLNDILQIEASRNYDIFINEIYPYLKALFDYFWYLWAKLYICYYNVYPDKKKIKIFHDIEKSKYEEFSSFVNRLNFKNY